MENTLTFIETLPVGELGCIGELTPLALDQDPKVNLFQEQMEVQLKKKNEKLSAVVGVIF